MMHMDDFKALREPYEQAWSDIADFEVCEVRWSRAILPLLRVKLHMWVRFNRLRVSLVVTHLRELLYQKPWWKWSRLPALLWWERQLAKKISRAWVRMTLTGKGVISLP